MRFINGIANTSNRNEIYEWEDKKFIFMKSKFKDHFEEVYSWNSSFFPIHLNDDFKTNEAKSSREIFKYLFCQIYNF